jgi:hypothetical protein
MIPVTVVLVVDTVVLGVDLKIPVVDPVTVVLVVDTVAGVYTVYAPPLLVRSALLPQGKELVEDDDG